MTTFYENDGSSSSDGGLASGPLASLFQSKYDYSILQYPADLTSSGKGHSVEFDISNVHSVSLNEVGASLAKVYAGVQATTIAAAAATAAAAAEFKNNTEGSLSKLSSGLMSAISPKDTASNFISSQQEWQAKVALYMPDSMEFQQSAQYGSVSIADAAKSLPLGVGKGARAITGMVDNSLVKLAISKAGYAFNPQAQMLFEGIDFRTYTLSFTFTPRSQEEAQNVNTIIKTFRKYASPTIVTASAGFFFKPPSIFKVTFKSNGVENLNINRVTDSVLESVAVNYAPNGWSAHKDGAPVQSTMVLNFKEIILVDRNKIEDNY